MLTLRSDFAKSYLVKSKANKQAIQEDAMIPAKTLSNALSLLNIAYNMIKDVKANISVEYMAYYIHNAANPFKAKSLMFSMHLPQSGDDAAEVLMQAKTIFIDGIHEANLYAENMHSTNWKDHDPENTIGKAMNALDCINEALRWWEEKCPVLDYRD